MNGTKCGRHIEVEVFNLPSASRVAVTGGRKFQLCGKCNWPTVATCNMRQWVMKWAAAGAAAAAAACAAAAVCAASVVGQSNLTL